jgi:phosphate transport system permease protein
MSTSVAPAPGAPSPSHAELIDELVARKLPRWAPYAVVLVAAVLALGIAAVTPVSGRAGTILLGIVLFIALLTGWSFAVEGRRHAVDRFATTLIYSSFIVAVIPLIAILASVIVQGIKVISPYFLQHSMRNVDPRIPGGGEYHAIIGTLELVIIAGVIAIPIGIMVAIYLVEFANRSTLSRVVSFFVDVMTGVPSIVAGLFIYSCLVLALGWQRSGFAGSLALCILMIPIVVRSSEEMFKLVPNELRESSYALGVPKYRTILRIVLPTALPGVITGSMLAVARVTGETAPLLLTTFFAQGINFNPFSGPQASLPTFMWDQISNGTDAAVARAWAAALTLIVFVLLLTTIARLLGRLSRVK